MKILQKKYLYSVLCAVSLVTLFGAQAAISQLEQEIDAKETTLDSNSDDDAGDYPLLGILLEAENRFEIPVYVRNKVALKSCEIEVEDVNDLTPASVSEFKSNACVPNSKVLFEVGKLNIHGCQWTEQESTKQPMEAFTKLENQFQLENFEVRFEEDELFCFADLITKNNQRYPMKGSCAVASMNSHKLINGKKPEPGNDPLFVIFEMDENDNFFKNETREDKLGPNPHLLLSVSVPLTQKASDYLAYMLSSEAIKACDADQK
ncbi:MAG: hypothetical protein RJB66_1224 [Pseudomonadota bacterium]|jgi:hypothetical protein